MAASRFSSSRRVRRWAVGGFFSLLLLLGVALHRDYGMGWDEPAERLNAFVSAKYVALRFAPALARHQPRLADIPDLHHHRDADHGVLFMLPWVGLEALVPSISPTEWAYWRHLAVFVVFVLGAAAVYRLGRWGQGWHWGLAGAAMLVLSPRLFAEAFYNYKDLVFLSVFALAMNTLAGLLRRPTLGRALLHAAATAAAIDVRAMGVLLPALTLGFGVLEMLYRPRQRRALAGALALYLPAMAVGTVLGWPYLWEQPLTNFLRAFQNFSHYTSNPLKVFYLGQFWSVQALPWHYAPLWVLLTTPVPYTLLFVVGVGTMLKPMQAGWQWLRRASSRRDLLVLAWFFGPLLLVIMLRSALYDGWRHLYFIYPAFVLVAVRGLRAGWVQWRRMRPGVGRRVGGVAVVSLVLSVGQVAWRMVAEHPHQNVYFSFLPGKVIEQNFERDYWGLSVKQGLEWVLAHDSQPAVSVSMDQRTEMTLRINAKMLPPASRARLRLVPPGSARYFLSIHRWHPGAYPASAGRPVHVVRVGGAVVLTVLAREGM